MESLKVTETLAERSQNMWKKRDFGTLEEMRNMSHEPFVKINSCLDENGLLQMKAQ